MSIVVTGSAGKTGRHIVNLLQSQTIPAITVSRHPGRLPESAVHFDWEDPSTYTLPLHAARDIAAVHLIVPAHIPPARVCEFIDLAVSRGVERFVLMSGSLDIPGDPIEGPIRAHLKDSGVPFCVLRPSRFFDNFSEMPESIRDEDKITSATGTARIGFVSCHDVAQVAVDCLLTKSPHCTEHFIVGPELLSFPEVILFFPDNTGLTLSIPQVAERFSRLLQRRISIESISVDEQKRLWSGLGLPEEWIRLMGEVEEMTAAGGEEVVYALKTNLIVGKTRLEEWARGNMELWTRSRV